MKLRRAGRADRGDRFSIGCGVGSGAVFVDGGSVGAAGVMLVEAGRKVADGALRYCGHGAALLAFVRLLFVNMADETNLAQRELAADYGGIVRRDLVCGIAAAFDPAGGGGEGGGARCVARGGLCGLVRALGGIATVYTSAATLLVALLLWDEATTAAVGLAWGLFGLALWETGAALREKPLLMQGRLVLVASFVRIFIADLNSVSRVGPVAAPVITVTLLAAIYYYAAFRTAGFARSARDAAVVRDGLAGGVAAV